MSDRFTLYLCWIAQQIASWAAGIAAFVFALPYANTYLDVAGTFAFGFAVTFTTWVLLGRLWTKIQNTDYGID